jgi:hypothetical protein
MPPFWDADGFRSAVERIQGIDYERICLAHFGCLEGDAARDFVEHAVPTYETWWDLFSQVDQVGKLDDVETIQRALVEKRGSFCPIWRSASFRCA